MIDLHAHSTASDGSLAPAALLDRAAALHLRGLALTDHDTVAGLAEARAQAARLGIRFLGGIELSARWRDCGEVHVLGYAVDGPDHAGLRAACDQLRAARWQRAQRMVANLQAAGVALTWEAVEAEAGTAPVGRPHVARALVAGGWAADFKVAFQRWLVPGAPAYAAHAKLEATAAVGLIRGAGGAAVLAHPGTLALDAAGLDALLGDLAAQGLAGIEAYWSQHPPAMVGRCLQLARRHQLLATGGSDFHGASKPEIELGMLAPGAVLSLDLMDALEQHSLRDHVSIMSKP